MSRKPIGVFDSGLGGLTAVKQLLQILPGEDIVYFGDTGRVPYGNRSRETIRKYAAQDMNFLLSQDVKMIIAACGTVSSVALDLGEALPVPFTGVVKTASQAAARATRSGRIGVIGTAATIRSGAYEKEIRQIDSRLAVYSQPCPLFVPLVEDGLIAPDEQITLLTAERYLAPLKEKKVDTLLLGCTHYPLLVPILAQVMGENVTLIDSGREVALWARQMLEQNEMLNISMQPGRSRFYVSDRVEGFLAVANMFLGDNCCHEIEQIDIDTLPTSIERRK